VLDRQRLGKQRVETLQIMNALLIPTYGWQAHSCVKMWRGYMYTLLEYQEAICEEWLSRGYSDTCWPKTLAVYREQGAMRKTSMHAPPWLGDYPLHISHQSKLVQKMPEWYRPRFPTVPDDLEYVWPGETNHLGKVA
jgi:hypothetical protein